MKVGGHKQFTLYLWINEARGKKYLQTSTEKHDDCIGELLTEIGHKGIPLKPIKLVLYPKYKHLDISGEDLNMIGKGLVPEIR